MNNIDTQFKQKGNVESIDSAKVICLLEEHGNQFHHLFEKLVLEAYSIKEKDLLLLECCKKLSPENIQDSFRHLYPIVANFLKGRFFKGWDHPKREEWETEFEKKSLSIRNSIQILQSVESHGKELKNSLLTLICCHNRLKESKKIDVKEIIPFLLDKTSHSESHFLALKEKLINSGKSFLQKKFEFLFRQTFSKRQDSLIESIESALKEKRRKIFIISGVQHFNDQNPSFKKEVDKVLVFLKTKPHLIFYPIQNQIEQPVVLENASF